MSGNNSTDFYIESRYGVEVEILPMGVEDGEFCIILHEDELVEIIRKMFDVKNFGLNHLIDVLRVTDPK